MRLIFSTFALLVTGFFFQLSAQNIIIASPDGNETTYELSQIQSMSFLETSLSMNLLSGTNETLSISDIRKIYFANVPVIETAVTENATLADKITVYPNPASENISLANLPDGQYQVQIYRIDGVLVSTSLLQDAGSSLYIGSLASGLYLLKINNQVIRFNKF